MKSRSVVTLLMITMALVMKNTDGRPSANAEPIKFSLDIKKEVDENVTENPKTLELNSRIKNGMELMSETRNNVAGAIGAANDIIEQGRSTFQSYEKAPFANLLPAKTRETVRLENEGDQAILERNKANNPISSFLQNILKPQPIVDTIKEEDKYGNNGDKFIGVGRALVNGFEGLSNFVNSVVDIPVTAAKKTSRGITEALNQIGSRLIGLQ